MRSVPAVATATAREPEYVPAQPPNRPANRGWDPDHLASALNIATRYARSGARRLALSQADQDDLRQDLLLNLLERQPKFDPQRATWDAFVTLVCRRAVIDRMRAAGRAGPVREPGIDLDLLPHGSSLTQPASGDLCCRLDLARLAHELPAAPARLLRHLQATGDVHSVQQGTPQSRASVFRRLRDLRAWLACAGLNPSTTAACERVDQTAETDSAPRT
jgi:DNA-directed RNA polymerase specialized sigma24 family protein